MYNAVFEADNGRVYYFGTKGKTIFDMEIGDGVAVDVGTSQGFLQVGETVENYTVRGRNITTNGVIYGADIDKRKKEMRGVFAPFTSGRLVIENKYYIRVTVKETPSFSPVKGDGRFTMLLFAPYPFFNEIETRSLLIGETKPDFSFPVNYSTPHLFGIKDATAPINIYNSGDVKADFSLRIRCNGLCQNVVLRNLNTFEELKLNGEMVLGDVINFYKADNGVLRCELIRDGQRVDVLNWVDDESNLFELQRGDNVISATDDNGGANLFVTLMFNPSVVAVYED